MDESKIPSRLKNIRLGMHLTQEEFADELDMDLRTYTRMEQGKARFVNKNLYRIEERSGHSVEEILTGHAPGEYLSDSGGCEQQLAALREFYEGQLREKEKTISNLNNYITTLKNE